MAMSEGNTQLTEFKKRVSHKENLLEVIEKSPALLSLMQHRPGLLGHFESRKEGDWEVLRAAFQKHYDKRVANAEEGETSRKAAFASLVLAVSAGPARKRKSKKRKK